MQVDKFMKENLILQSREYDRIGRNLEKRIRGMQEEHSEVEAQ